MKLHNFLSSAAIALIGVTAMSVAHARGGWDGNGLSVSGMALVTQTERVAQVTGKSAISPGQGAQLRYVELPAASARSKRLLTR